MNIYIFTFFQRSLEDLTPQQFLQEEKSLRAEHDQEYSVFLEVPEMHPDYEEKYEEFITNYLKENGRDANEEEAWMAHWPTILEKIKQSEWEAKRKVLVEKYKKVLMQKKLKNTPPVEPVVTAAPRDPDPVISDSVLMQSLAFVKSSNEKDKKLLDFPINLNLNLPSKLSKVPEIFSSKSSILDDCNGSSPVAKAATSNSNTLDKISPSSNKNINQDSDISRAYDILEQLTGSLGILGPALRGLISMAKEKGTTTKEAMEIFIDTDNITLMKMSVEKFKTQLKSASQTQHAKLIKGIAIADELIKYAEKRVRDSKSNADLELIARATLGKKPSDILDFIKNSFAFEGKTVTNDDLSKMYLTVSTLHLGMTLQSGGGLKSPETALATAKSTSSKTQTNACMIKSSIPDPVENVPVSSTNNSILQASMSHSKQIPISFNVPPPSLPVANVSGNGSTLSNVQSASLNTSAVSSGSLMSIDQTTDRSASDETWFVKEVKSVLRNPSITIEMFNRELANIFRRKPLHYTFSASDIKLAGELQNLGTSSTSGEDFISSLKSALNV